MEDVKKLDRWADKLLDTGKRNNLINFRDTKASSAEVVFPACENIFSKCSIGHVFEIYDPKIADDDEDEIETDEEETNPEEKKLNRSEYLEAYSSKIRNDRHLLVYAQTPNPMTAVRNIAKKAKEMQDETGINVAYLAFGFVRWKEKEFSEVSWRAPLLLVHVNILTGSIIDPVKIEICDDDVVVNPTFDYLLKADYGLSLPAYEDGETLTSYYGKVTSLVQKLGWEVLDECKLGTFSFLKINMYEDLKQNAEKILENKNVRALLGDADPEVVGLSEQEQTVENPLIELHTVVDADSSQIEAIEMAKSGKSFVLQGPPGTGKSQTITNVIAECLHDGKKVLFVSEKQAALNVVYDKLKKAGLTDFCLELHSHKANKKAVIEELNRTLEVPKSTVSSSAEEEIRQKQESQKRLDQYAKALHQKRETINKSLYQLFELYSAERNYPVVPYLITDLKQKGSDYLLQAVRLLEQYVEYLPSVGKNYKENIWYGFQKEEVSFEERGQLRNDLLTLFEGYKKLNESAANCRSKYGMEVSNYAEIMRVKALLSFCADSDVITPSLMKQAAYDQAKPCIDQMAALSAEIVPRRNSLLSRYDAHILQEVDGEDLRIKLTEQFGGALSHLFNKNYKNLIARLQGYASGGQKIGYQDALDLSEQLVKLKGSMRSFEENAQSVQKLLGPCYQGVDTDWEQVQKDVNTLQAFLGQKTPGFGLIADLGPDEFSEKKREFRSVSGDLGELLRGVTEAKENVSQYMDPSEFDLDNSSFETCIRKLQQYLSEFDRLGNWLSFMELVRQMEKADLQPFIDEAISKQTAPEEIVHAFRKSFYKQWIEYIVFSTPVLSAFTRIKQDQSVKNFVAKDNMQYEISKIQIRSELSQKRPNLDMVAGGSAVSILRREGQKKRKQMPIRKLLSEIGSLVQIIKPCFLMSPLSVSTFLDPEKIEFDTIVFDEASQIFPQDAIGAIYRGKQLIVVGDSKQMPPSNFFNASTDIDDEDDEYNDITDFESILDICSSVFSTERLSWHYRSHYEQLIAFSNANFYNNNLVTFPSASTDHKGIGVDYYFADGIFDRKSKTNRKEAEFIVDLVFKNIEKFPDRSLGVVAFSASQQNLIDKLLSKKREEDPSYEWFFKADNKEPFFVKNLETVQGDERDTIIFSVAYAKDSQGRFIHNFGPLNRVGGERRLNVAVTRAKDNVQLVASIHYTDINLSNSGAEGVRLLRAYLDYAQNGEQALERTITVANGDHFDSYLEQEVCDFLRDQGYTVDTQVGCSGYRIDLGLRLPESSNYLLAIECDGATYHSSKNARDRDSLRQRVLENMGWQFYRIWSTDWYRNKSVEKDRLLHAVKGAVINAKNKSENPGGTNSNQEEDIAEAVQDKFVTEVTDSTADFPKYRELNTMEVMREQNFQLVDAIRKILETEAPLSEEYLLKRIVWFFQRAKVTNVVMSEYERRMLLCENKGIIRRNGFLYLQGNPDIVLRIPGDRREIKYISLEELSDGLYTLIKQNVTTTKDGLYKTLTNLLGFSRTGEAIVARFDQALALLIKADLVKMDGDLIVLTSKSL